MIWLFSLMYFDLQALSIEKQIILLEDSLEHKVLKTLSRDYQNNLKELERVKGELNRLPAPKNDIVGGTIGYQTPLREHPIPVKPIHIILDFGKLVDMDAVAIFPTQGLRLKPVEQSLSFPREFKVELLKDLEGSGITVYEHSKKQIKGRNGYPLYIEFEKKKARYVRLDIKHLSKRNEVYQCTLAEIMVFDQRKNIAFTAEVLEDTDRSYERGPYWSRKFLNDGQQPFGIPYGKEISPTSGYTSPTMRSIPYEDLWVQIDFGEPKSFDEIRLYAIQSYAHQDYGQDYIGYAFPPEYIVQASNHENMDQAQTVVHVTQEFRTAFHNQYVPHAFDEKKFRYLRVTALTLYTHEDVPSRGHVFGFSEVGIYHKGKIQTKDAVVTTPFGISEDLRGTALMNPRRILPGGIVDGFSSHHNIPDLRDWVKKTAQRGELLLKEKELKLKLVDSKEVAKALLSNLFAVMVMFLFLLPLGIWALAIRQRQKQLFRLREQISSDLHDDIGSNISSMRINSEIAVYKLKKHVDIPKELDAISQIAKETNDSLRDMMWILHDRSDISSSLPLYFKGIAERLLGEMNWQFKDEISSQIQLPLQIKRHFTLFYKETLHNIVKHSKADQIQILLKINSQKVYLNISDDGKGIENFDVQDTSTYPQSLYLRAQKLQGDFKVTSNSVQGTTIQLQLAV